MTKRKRENVKRVPAGSGHRCAPKEGEVICVRAKRLDRSIGHRHFPPDKWRDAVAYAKQVEAEEGKPSQLAAGPGDRGGTITFRAYGERWRAAQSPADPQDIRTPLNRAYAVIGDDALEEIDGLRLLEMQKDLLSRFKRNTVRVTMIFVKMVLRQAVADGRLKVDPTFNIRLPHRGSHDRDGVVTDEDIPSHAEALAILTGAPLRWRLGIALGFGCGLRVGEMLGLLPEYFDLEAGTLRVFKQQQDRGHVPVKTWRGDRTIQLPGTVLFEARCALESSTPGVLLHAGPRGGKPYRYAFYESGWYPALEAAGLSRTYNFHSARHYCISALLERGVSTPAVAHYVGDSVGVIERVYAHKIRDAPGVTKAALDQVLAAPPAPPAPPAPDE